MHPALYALAAAPGVAWIFGSETPAAALGAVFATIVPPVALKIVSALNERDTRRRQLHDCEYQHAAWKLGDDWTATYGHYPPTEVTR